MTEDEKTFTALKQANGTLDYLTALLAALAHPDLDVSFGGPRFEAEMAKRALVTTRALVPEWRRLGLLP